jgi:hypothetical protein
MFASSDTSQARLASSVTQRAGEIDVMRAARDDVLAKLAREVIDQCLRRDPAPPVARPAPPPATESSTRSARHDL